MKDSKEFRLSFYQAVVDDPEEMAPCDDELCLAGLSYKTIDYFANVAESEYELALEDYRVEIDSLKAEIGQRDNQIKLLSQHLEDCAKIADGYAEETSTWDRKHAAEDIAEAIRAITTPAPSQEGESE
jgi:hypothetical protein